MARTLIKYGTVVLSLTLSIQAFSSPILVDETLGGQIKVYSTGNVWLEYLGSSAGYTNSLLLDDVALFSTRDWWQSESDASFTRGSGCSIDCEQHYGSDPNAIIPDLGLALDRESIWQADAVLDFSLLALSRNWTSEGDANIYQAGNANLNPDGIAHVFASTFWDEELQLSYTEIGFEDIWGGGDEDYDDLVIRAYNTYDPIPEPIPEPASLSLLLLGLAGIGYSRRKQNAA